MSERLTEEEVLDQVCAGEPDQSASDDADTNEIARLAKLTPLQYDRERKVAAENLDVRASILDKLVRTERDKLGIDKDDGKQGHAISFPDPEPWPEPVAGAALLDELAAAVRKHVVLADHARDACALWIAHTYLVNCFLVSPRLAIRSAVKGCGKTTLLDVFEHLAAKPLRTSSVTASVTFRLIEAHQPSLLIDEADKILNEDRRDLLGILNDGHRRGGRSVRNVPIGDGYEPRAFATFSPLAIALIGSPPAELYDRSVVIDLKRRLPSEPAEQLRIGRTAHFEVFPRKIARWSQDHADQVAAADPQMPSGIYNREADNWSPLLAIADVAGGQWPERARKAAEAMRNAEGGDGSRLEILLRDIRDAFADKAEMPSADLVKALVELEGHPWAELGKSRKPLTQNGLARRLKPLGIAPGHIDSQTRTRGYKLLQFEEVFSRYLPSEGVSKCSTVRNAANTSTSDNSKPFGQDPGRTVAESQKPNNDGISNGRTVAKGDSGSRAHMRPAKPRSDDLPYTGPVVPVPDMGPDSLDEHGAPRTNGSDEPGLSRRRIRDLADQYQEIAYANAQENGGDTLTDKCDRWLRQTLAQEGVLPEFIEVEFRRIVAEAFRL
jgi:putative DNA primase/helicase